MTSTEIGNLALSYLGQNSIVDIVDTSSELARRCKLHYEHCKQMVLKEFNWGFAKRQERLVLLDNQLKNDYLYAYAYPEKCLFVRRIYQEKDQSETLDKNRFDIFSLDDNTQVIACNVESANIEYTYDVNDGNAYSPHFIEALSRLLASNLAMSLVGNTAVQQMQYQLYQVAIAKASEQSAKERLRILERPNSYMSAREM